MIRKRTQEKLEPGALRIGSWTFQQLEEHNPALAKKIQQRFFETDLMRDLTGGNPVTRESLISRAPIYTDEEARDVRRWLADFRKVLSPKYQEKWEVFLAFTTLSKSVWFHPN